MRDYLLVLCVTAAATYLLTGPVRKFAIKVRAMPEIRARDVHREPTPRLGGISMFLGLCAGLLVAGRLTGLGAAFDTFDQSRALLSGAALIWLCGVLDDKFELSSLIMLGGQTTAAGAMVMQGMTILWLPVPGVGTVELTQWQGALLTVLLVAVSKSAVNFVDGLDGLATGMVCLTAVAFFLFACRVRASNGIETAAPAMLFAAILIGMCLGFLPHNAHPARIFLGNSGLMLLGLVLAAGTISMTGQVDPGTLKSLAGSEDAAVREMLPVCLPLLLPLFIIAFQAADLALMIVRRTRKDRLSYPVDRGHLHHRLLEIGYSHNRAVLIAYSWSALVASGTLAYAARDGFMWFMTAATPSAGGTSPPSLANRSPRTACCSSRWPHRVTLSPPSSRHSPLPRSVARSSPRTHVTTVPQSSGTSAPDAAPA
ncbi:undecaprenyl/decaprenyl-phosphate alpha-N-acetylglucosaminyl 1-phosphate transferase [Streptomyces sp. NBC_01460]|uniref:glycosyltransferase family 4 protein n=1 Tax=Streptomyces sp. NBC_01460 TaxID=2903875 RepID=UPI002E341D7E|nr:MraY family glycosyltransferase [Streptomyces sp. NBC_01460]